MSLLHPISALARAPGLRRRGRALPLRLISLVALALALASCAIRLAPEFDRTILDGLISANQQTMVHFASVANGTSAGTFGKRKPTYDELIGKFDALRVQASARPAPRPLSAPILGAGASKLQPPTVPTPAVLAAVIETLTVMRDSDAEFGLRPNDVRRFKNEYEISVMQSLTYERALER